MKPICIKCHRFFRPVKNDFLFVEGMPENSDVLPGLAEPERWKPYKLWAGDKWKCENCGNEIIVGCAQEPIREHYQSDFEQVRKRYSIDFQVNDC